MLKQIHNPDESYGVVGGVDTHKDMHVAAVVTTTGDVLRDNQKPCSATIRRNTSWLNRAPGILGGQSRSRQRRWPKGPGLTGQDTGRTIEIVVHPMIEFQCGTVPL